MGSAAGAALFLSAKELWFPGEADQVPLQHEKRRTQESGDGAKHVNVLQHLMGFLKNHLPGVDRAYRRWVYLR